MAKKWDVVMIGGGLSGLVAANFLAEADLSVLLLESGKHVGGRAQTDMVKQQYFNKGPHALYKKGAAKPILEELGITLHGNVPKLDGVLFEKDKAYAAPFTPLGIFTTKLLSFKERMEWLGISLKFSKMDTDKFKDQTFQAWVQQTTSSYRIHSLLYVFARLSTYCHAPEKVSAKVILSHLKRIMGGVIYLDGGWQTMIDQLHNKAVISGVQVQAQSSVKQIVPDERGPFRIILSNGDEIEGKRVLCTAGPHELNKMLSDVDAPSQKSFFEKMKPVKGATLDVALKQLPNPKLLFAMDVTEPFYYSVHSKDARLSEDDHSVVLHMFKYHHPDDTIDEKKVKMELEQYLEKIQPGWQKYKITSRCIPNITVNHRLPQIGDERELHHFETDIPGLYMAGDWTSPQLILSEGTVSSGKQAAKEIIQKEMKGFSANQ